MIVLQNMSEEGIGPIVDNRNTLLALVTDVIAILHCLNNANSVRLYRIDVNVEQFDPIGRTDSGLVPPINAAKTDRT